MRLHHPRSRIHSGSRAPERFGFVIDEWFRTTSVPRERSRGSNSISSEAFGRDHLARVLQFRDVRGRPPGSDRAVAKGRSGHVPLYQMRDAYTGSMVDPVPRCIYDVIWRFGGPTRTGHRVRIQSRLERIVWL